MSAEGEKGVRIFVKVGGRRGERGCGCGGWFGERGTGRGGGILTIWEALWREFGS